MRDLLQDCMEDFRRKAKLTTAVPPSDFRELFCSKCNNTSCVNRQAGDPLAVRVATQFDRLMNPMQSDPTLPKYAQISQNEWEDMTQEAMKLIISSRRNDWEVPILDGVPEAASSKNTQVVDSAIRELAKAKGVDAPQLPEPSSQLETLPCGHPVSADPAHGDTSEGATHYCIMCEAEALPEPEPEPRKAVVNKPPAHPKKEAAYRPANKGNAPSQDGMIGGGPAPTPKKAHDPWAVPDIGKKVSTGATVKFGSGGVIDDE